MWYFWNREFYCKESWFYFETLWNFSITLNFGVIVRFSDIASFFRFASSLISSSLWLMRGHQYNLYYACYASLGQSDLGALVLIFLKQKLSSRTALLHMTVHGEQIAKLFTLRLFTMCNRSTGVKLPFLL